MTPEVVVELGHQVLWITAMLAAPLLLSALAVGVLVGIFQAATQIQEMTLSFIPKLIAMVVALFAMGHWMLQMLTEFTTQLYRNIPGLIG